MKILLSWLNDFAPFGTDHVALAEAMDELGLAVDGVDVVGAPIDGVITAKVLRRAKHPNADRIGLVFVDVGDGEELQICCGAFNMEPGDVVPLATIGTTMPDGRDIQRSKMRGEWSNGMLCSSRELGLGDDHGGILLLPGDTPLGVPVFDAMGIAHDVVFHLDLTRNRPDCWGHGGVARDLAAKLGLPFTLPDPDVTAVGPSTGVTVEIRSPELCGRFTAARVTGVTITESPRWLQDRLVRCGMRPINNVVDASNAVMLELNRPNHAYDEAKVPGAGFVVRAARPGERTVTLDGVERELTGDDCVICDARSEVVGIGGIMGGATSEVDADTTTVLLEQAWFEPTAISTTAARLGLRSEAGARFERGCDPFDTDLGARRFVELLRLTSPGATLHEPVEAIGGLPPFGVQHVRLARVNAVLGTDLTAERCKDLLDPIGFATRVHASGDLEVTVPSWRFDCVGPASGGEIDVIEEIARHHGYGKIPRRVPAAAHPGRLTARQLDRRLVRDVLVGAGCTEVMPMPFLAPGDLERAGLDATGLTIANPLVADESVLRTSLLPGMVKTVAYNLARRVDGVRIFEIGHVFGLPPLGQLLPDEREWMAVALAGAAAPAAVAVLDEVLDALHAGPPELVAATPAGLHPTRAAEVRVQGVTIGQVGEVDPQVLERHGVDGRVAWLQLDLDVLLALPHGAPVYRPVSRFPSSDVDLAFLVPDEVPADAVASTLQEAAGALVETLRLFDVYRGPGIAAGERSLAFAVRLQAADRTLTDAEVAEVRTRAIEAVEDRHGARLRG